MIRLIIFDFDGTLGDTRANIVLTMRQTLEALGYPVASEEAIAAAREAVDAFSDAEKKGLTKLSVLEEAEKTLEAIKEKIASADALIESIGEVTLVIELSKKQRTAKENNG